MPDSTVWDAKRWKRIAAKVKTDTAFFAKALTAPHRPRSHTQVSYAIRRKIDGKFIRRTSATEGGPVTVDSWMIASKFLDLKEARDWMKRMTPWLKMHGTDPKDLEIVVVSTTTTSVTEITPAPDRRKS